MDQISFRCTTCDHVLKVNADRAGRKAKCNRCNALLTIPAASPPVDEIAMASAAPPPKPFDDDDEPNDGKGYGFFLDPKEEEERKRKLAEAQKAGKKKKDEPTAQIKRRIKTIYDVQEWKKFRVGIVIMLSSLGFWGLQFLLHEVVVVIGLIRGPEYSEVVDRVLFKTPDDPNEWPQPGRTMPLDRMGFMMALVSGYPARTVGKVFFILGEAFLVLTGGMFFVSYFFFRTIPHRYGSGQLLKGMMVLSGINVLLSLFCRLLPAATNFGPALIPLVVPEVPMNTSNIERVLPLQLFWMHSPFWESFLTLLVQVAFWTEPVLIGVLIWTCGKILKEHTMEEQGHGLAEMAAGVYFIGFAYTMISFAGTSVVLIVMLQVIYLVWIGFILGYLIRFALVLNNTRILLDKLIESTVAEERATGKKKKTGGLRREGDEDEEEDEDDDDDEYDDDDD